MAPLPTRVTSRTGAAVLGALLAFGALTACGAPPPERTTAGRTGPPQRIVSLIPATTEMLFAMGAGDRVVGVGSYDRFPPDVASRPRVGALLDPDTERILALRPDLVIVYHTQIELQQQLDRAGVPYHAYVHRALPDIMETIRTLGARVGADEAAERLAANMEQELETIRRASQDRRRPSVLLVFARDPGGLRNIYASGGYGFLADLVAIAGGDNVFADVARESVQVGTEMLLTLRPELIIELQYGDAASSPPRSTGDWNALPALPAVRSGRIHVLTGDEFVVPGPRVVEGARQIARVLQNVP